MSLLVCVKINPVLLAGEGIFCPDERVGWVGDELFGRRVSLHLGRLLLIRAAPVLRWVHTDTRVSVHVLFFASDFQIPYCCRTYQQHLQNKQMQSLELRMSHLDCWMWHQYIWTRRYRDDSVFRHKSQRLMWFQYVDFIFKALPVQFVSGKFIQMLLYRLIGTWFISQLCL